MHWMPEILYRFRRVCPDIDVDLRMVDHELEPFELLEKWETDVIFAARQPGFACDWTPLWNDPMCAILPQDYPLTGDEFPIEEFTDKEFLMPYGRFDLDARAVFAQNGVEPRIRPVLCRRRDGHPHGGQGAGPFDDGGNDDPRDSWTACACCPSVPQRAASLGWGCIRARRCQRGSPGCAAACWNSSRTRRGRAQRNRDGEEKMRKGTWRDLRPEIALVWRLSLPAILTQITTIVMQYIDSAMVGARGANASAAIGLVASSTWLFGG